MPPIPIAVVGMHRSGTSLVAGMLEAAGLPVGSNLMPGNRGNPHGYFEDLEFVELHDSILKANGTDWTLRGAPEALRLDPAHADAAQRLITARAHLAAWGWKDPRTTLFLDAWSDFLPQLRTIVVFRSSATVASSLIRRGDRVLMHRFPGSEWLRRRGIQFPRARLCFDIWRAYNQRALAHAALHPEQTAFVDADDIRSSWPNLVRWLGGEGVQLADFDIEKHIDPSLFRREASAKLERIARMPRYSLVTQRLGEAAERSRSAASLGAR